MYRLLSFLLVIVLWPCPTCLSQSFHTAIVPSPAAGTMFIHPERIPLKAGGMFAAERATMFVPLNRNKTGSDVVSIDVYRFPRSDKANPETPPFFILQGGPGLEGLEKKLASQGTFEQQFQSFLDLSDVVVVGQRGIGSSRPATLIEQTTEPPSAEQPFDAGQAQADFQKVLAVERDFWLERGVDLSGFNVIEAATDVRDISQALGYEKIVLHGGSFGSHWGMTIMRNHPQIVARAVLHGMEGPDHTWDHPGWFWNVYKRVAKEAESNEQLKPHIPAGGLISAAEGLVQRAQEKPITVILNEGKSSEKKVLIDTHAMQRLVRGFSGGWPSWPADIIAMHNGDFEKAARSLLLRSTFRRRDFSTASFWMLDSGSGISQERLAEFESDPARQIVGSTYWHYSAGSPVWQTDLGDTFRQSFDTAIPTVIVHGTWDTQTPWENAEEFAPHFTNSRFISVRRGSHGALGEAMKAGQTFKPALIKFMVTGDFSDLPDEVQLPGPKWTLPPVNKDR